MCQSFRFSISRSNVKSKTNSISGNIIQTYQLPSCKRIIYIRYFTKLLYLYIFYNNILNVKVTYSLVARATGTLCEKISYCSTKTLRRDIRRNITLECQWRYKIILEGFIIVRRPRPLHVETSVHWLALEEVSSFRKYGHTHGLKKYWLTHIGTSRPQLFIDCNGIDTFQFNSVPI